MSLILEALKKSEQQRRLGEAPTLGSPVVATRRQRSFLPVLAILIVVAAADSWWLMRPEAPGTQAPVITSDRSPPAAAPQKPARAPAATARDQARERAKQDALARALPATGQDKRALTPGTKPLVPPAPAKPSPATAAPPASTGAAPRGATKPGEATPPPASDRITSAGAKPAAAPANDKAAVTTQAATQPAPARATAKPAPPAPPLPMIWELPYSVRKDLPAIDLSMHVYSADPAQRFVVLKGDRHVEGDEVDDNLVLSEIRRDGVVFDYKGQKFFYPRNGR